MEIDIIKDFGSEDLGLDVTSLQGGERVIIIEGTRENGTQFRPSDWLDRISSAFASFGKDQRLRYAKEIRPSVIDGQRVLVVEPALAELYPKRFNAVMKFARDNQLRTTEKNVA